MLSRLALVAKLLGIDTHEYFDWKKVIIKDMFKSRKEMFFIERHFFSEVRRAVKSDREVHHHTGARHRLSYHMLIMLKLPIKSYQEDPSYLQHHLEIRSHPWHLKENHPELLKERLHLLPVEKLHLLHQEEKVQQHQGKKLSKNQIHLQYLEENQVHLQFLEEKLFHAEV